MLKICLFVFNTQLLAVANILWQQEIWYWRQKGKNLHKSFATNSKLTTLKFWLHSYTSHFIIPFGQFSLNFTDVLCELMPKKWNWFLVYVWTRVMEAWWHWSQCREPIGPTSTLQCRRASEAMFKFFSKHVKQKWSDMSKHLKMKLSQPGIILEKDQFWKVFFTCTFISLDIISIWWRFRSALISIALQLVFRFLKKNVRRQTLSWDWLFQWLAFED